MAMTKPRYIYVKNWDRFQSERTPNWIRVWARGLLHDDAWIGLTLPQRGLLLGIWMLVSQSGNGRLSADKVQLNQQLGGTNAQQRSIDALVQAGFITLRSKKARRPLGVDSALEEKRKEKKIYPPTPLPAESGGGGGLSRNGRAPRPMRTAEEREEYNRFLASIGAPPLPPEELDP